MTLPTRAEAEKWAQGTCKGLFNGSLAIGYQHGAMDMYDEIASRLQATEAEPGEPTQSYTTGCFNRMTIAECFWRGNLKEPLVGDATLSLVLNRLLTELKPALATPSAPQQSAGVWVKASEGGKNLPKIKKYGRLAIRYKGQPDLLRKVNGNWCWVNEKWEDEDYKVHAESWTAIEFLDESPAAPVGVDPGAFAEWTSENKWWYDVDNEIWWKVETMLAKDKTTTADLITLYKQANP